MKELKGEEAQRFLQSELGAALKGLASTLSPYEPVSTFMAFANTIRAVEEFINFPFGLDDDSLEQDFFGLRLYDVDCAQLIAIRERLNQHFDKGVVDRIFLLTLQASAMFQTFASHGLREAASGLLTVRHALGYFQSRRRHLLAVLYSLPSACKGSAKLAPTDTLNVMLTQAEYSGILITTNYSRLMLSLLFPDFKVTLDDKGYSCSHYYDVLDPSFLEPERAGLMEMTQAIADSNLRKTLEITPKGKLFSAAELRNDVLVIAQAYGEFKLADHPNFKPIADFVTSCSRICEDDYYVRLTATQFAQMAAAHGLTPSMQSALIQSGEDYVKNLDSYAPFITVEDGFMATVALLSRFVHRWKILTLNRVRRFQIRSGFILEESVKEALTRQGYNVTDIKRINRSEFDVVAILDDVIYNIQCKNNLIDYSRIETNPRLFVRYTRQLDRYYSKALAKEESRENLLKAKLHLANVVHVVVSRFPIASANQRVVSFTNIKQFRKLASALHQKPNATCT